MKKTTSATKNKPSATKPTASKLVAVRKAAQNPVHATRAEIRRAIRAVAIERAH
ncbi:MAG: hypothetical protein JO227_21115 [Acetobacteraceae bacterium]|nr:hypothetical protein [Acetobacteraceae bacterium]